MDAGVVEGCLPNSWREEVGQVAQRVRDRWEREWRVSVGRYLRRGAAGRSFRIGPLGLVVVGPAFEEGNGGAEVVVEGEEQVDVVEVLLAAEVVGKVVAWVDGGVHFAVAWGSGWVR